jgi:hypothetical protein
MATLGKSTIFDTFITTWLRAVMQFARQLCQSVTKAAWHYRSYNYEQPTAAVA